MKQTNLLLKKCKKSSILLQTETHLLVYVSEKRQEMNQWHFLSLMFVTRFEILPMFQAHFLN